MKRKIEARKVLSLFLGMLILLCTLYLVFNQVMALKDAREGAAREKDALAKASLRIQQLASMKENAGEIKKQIERYNHLMPDTPEEGILLNNVQTAANRSGVKLSQIKFEERVDKKAYIEMPFKIAFEGRYHNLLNLLQEMRNGPRSLRIDDVKISKGQKELPYVRVDITASAFHVPGAKS